MTDSEQSGAQLPYATPTHSSPDSPPFNRYDFATLSVRLLGIYLIVEALPIVINVVSTIVVNRGFYRVYSYSLVSLFTFFVVGVLLFVMAQRIGAKLLPPLEPHRGDPPRASGVQLHGAAIATCGLILLAYRSVPGLVIDIWAYYNRPGSRTSELLAQHIIETLLGIFLFFGASAIASYWDRTRQPPNETVEQNTLPS
jgi:hypothetical protein